MSLAPENDGAGQGILLAGSNGPIILAPPQHSVPAVNLLRALLPDNQFQVPATRQTASLISLLPVPDFVPGTTGNLPSHTPTRLSAQPPGSPAPIRQPRVR